MQPEPVVDARACPVCRRTREVFCVHEGRTYLVCLTEGCVRRRIPDRDWTGSVDGAAVLEDRTPPTATTGPAPSARKGSVLWVTPPGEVRAHVFALYESPIAKRVVSLCRDHRDPPPESTLTLTPGRRACRPCRLRLQRFPKDTPLVVTP